MSIFNGKLNGALLIERNKIQHGGGCCVPMFLGIKKKDTAAGYDPLRYDADNDENYNGDFTQHM